MRIGIPAHGIELNESNADVRELGNTQAPYISITESGTPDRPIKYTSKGNYLNKKIVIDGSNRPVNNVIIDFVEAPKIEAIGAMNNVICRNSHFYSKDGISGGGSVFKGLSGRIASNILIYNCNFYDGGNWQADFDEDINGLRIGDYSNNVHVYNCKAWHNSGDGFSVYGSNENLKNVFINRCVAFENKQTGFWSKQASRVVFSENMSYNHAPIGTHPSAYGAGMGFQYGPEDIWFICNGIFNCNFGIQSQSTSGMGNGKNCYILGNKIHQITPSRFDQSSTWGNAGITLASNANKHIFHNIFHNCHRGVNVIAAQKLEILGNVFNAINNEVINIDATDDPIIENNVASVIPWLKLDRHTYTGWRELKLATGIGMFNRVKVPDFTNADGGDFTATNLNDNWTRYGIYDIYKEQFGQEIFLDVMRYLGE